MPKRGQAQPFRVTYVWSHGPKGSTAHTTRDAAEAMAAQVRRNAENRDDGATVVVTVTDRREAKA